MLIVKTGNDVANIGKNLIHRLTIQQNRLTKRVLLVVI